MSPLTWKDGKPLLRRRPWYRRLVSRLARNPLSAWLKYRRYHGAMERQRRARAILHRTLPVWYRDADGMMVKVGMFDPADWSSDREKVTEAVEEAAHAWNNRSSS